MRNLGTYICTNSPTEAKRPVLKPANDEEEEVERDDELPTVVVLRKGDVGEEEYMEMRRRLKGGKQTAFKY